MSRDDTYYQAMISRDHRFDGKFFVGVKTTGIYCRPICPAKPKRQNVVFFHSHLEAERAGFRPCLRCRPESAPQSPAWVGTSAVVQRAIKIINTQQTLELDENKFAERFGVTARHLRRLFMNEIGKTPKQLSFENRLNLTRKLITETNLPMAEIAFASGFKSIRRFNEAFKERFNRSPSLIRRNKIPKHQGLVLSLPYRPPFDFDGLLCFYKAHQTGDLEWFCNNRMHRIVMYGGQVGKIAIANDPDQARLLIDIDFPSTAVIHTVMSRVRSLFDLDSDPIVVANKLETDSRIKNILKKHQGIRLPSGWDPFETSVSAILGQFVSVAFGRSLVRELIDLLGEDSGFATHGRAIKLFPTPEKIASSTLHGLKTTSARKRTLINFAAAVAEKRLSLEATQDVEKFIADALSIKGIGPWTANYMALKVLRHTDAFPHTDLILARALDIHTKEVVDSLRPWRGYAAALFWREYSTTLKRKKQGSTS